MKVKHRMFWSIFLPVVGALFEVAIVLFVGIGTDVFDPKEQFSRVAIVLTAFMGGLLGFAAALSLEDYKESK